MVTVDRGKYIDVVMKRGGWDPALRSKNGFTVVGGAQFIAVACIRGEPPRLSWRMLERDTADTGEQS